MDLNLPPLMPLPVLLRQSMLRERLGGSKAGYRSAGIPLPAMDQKGKLTLLLYGWCLYHSRYPGGETACFVSAGM